MYREERAQAQIQDSTQIQLSQNLVSIHVRCVKFFLAIKFIKLNITNYIFVVYHILYIIYMLVYVEFYAI
jgi:hypothetical protein